MECAADLFHDVRELDLPERLLQIAVLRHFAFGHIHEDVIDL